MNTHNQQQSNLGLGLRLRQEYLDSLEAGDLPIDWIEVISESCLDVSETRLRRLEHIREHYPIVLHGISLGIGSPWPIDQGYLDQLKRLIERFRPAWISDHLCWGGADDIQGQLLHIPYSREMIDHMIPRIEYVQEYLGCQMVLENVPSEEIDPKTEISEAEFIHEVAVASDSLILLDIDNLNTTSMCQGFDPSDYLNQLPVERIQQIHLAGATVLCEAEDRTGQESETDPVWKLFLRTLELCGPVTTMIERLDTIPPLAEMLDEVNKARCALGKHYPSYLS